ncbi:uncharacterized protein B0H18DRAFT_1122291 [Fomitopsis serialis]|uniref:uncharacterized protein n=1 Tax=Fomitopsis serialis TaxID=139415 RepID=UPI0020086C7A|nr:uncharacterized protein B0H18DRAFT_1122291 [Neoantrodia serialis]KAH9919854.1 hypothetical protein B0H18DRAFT_1122291 [Neoantrodia serialis]
MGKALVEPLGGRGEEIGVNIIEEVKDHEHTTFPSNGEWLQLLPKLDYLASLRLRQLSFFIPNELKSNMHTLVPRLQTLDLKTMDFRADDLASLIRASSALSTLILRSASAISGSLSSSVAPTNDMLVNTVNTLVWDPSAATGQTSPLIPVTQWLEGAQRRLRRLAITRIDSEPTPLMLVQKLLSDSGDSLEDLFLEFTDTTDANGLAPLLNLGGNTRLRTLHIAVHSDPALHHSHVGRAEHSRRVR